MKNKSYVIGLTVLALIFIVAVLIFRNNSELNETNEETMTISKTPTSSLSVSPTSVSSEKTYNMSDVEKHDNKADCWLAIDGNVYNVTAFIDKHPGGDEILRGCGADATDLFNSVGDHARGGARDLLPAYLIGKLQ